MSEHARLRSALNCCLERRLTFAAFRRPGQAPELWAQRTAELENVEGALLYELNEVFLFAPFDLQGERLPFIRSDVELRFAEIDPDIEELWSCAGSSPEAAHVASGGGDMRASMEDAKQAIAAQQLQKVVLSRSITVALDRTRLADLFLNAMQERPHAFIALMHAPGYGTWLGASPERLVLAEDDRVRVDALAGTMRTEEVEKDPSGWGPKERHEQEIVSRNVLETFTRLGIHDVSTIGPEVMSAGSVSHLRTTVTGELDGRPLSDLVLALHPTPAVCGVPTAAARTFIARNEGRDRELYTGFWGPWSADGITELFVNIRCLRALEKEAVLHVGAGITLGSDVEAEWRETEEKARTWLAPIEALRS